ncbi:MAG: hypothetical protein Q9213_006569 [Squamulea squamosa]
MRIDQLPVEIISEICENVSEVDIPSLRLTSRLLAEVATPFLLDEIHLVFKPDSFQRLLEISRHPVISRAVTSLLYEIDSLATFETRSDWEDRVFEPSYLELLQRWPKRNACEEEQQDALQREKEQRKDRCYGNRKERYQEDDLAKGWDSYSVMYTEQELLRRNGHGFEDMYSAFRALPNLGSITMSEGCTIVTRTKYLDKTFSASLQRLGSQHDTGIPQARALLLSAARAGLSLHEVQLGYVDWQFLQADEADFLEMKNALKSVTTFEVHISTGCNEVTDEIGITIPECSEYLKSHRFWHLIKDTPLLEDLTIAFDWFEPTCPAQLDWLIGSSRWEHLATVAFECIDTDELSCIAFFRRHQDTLREVSLDTIRLITGEWPAVLEEMHDALSLTSAQVTGRLLGDDPPQEWYLDPTYQDPKLDEQSKRTRAAIEDYLIGWGDCPLRDEDEHPQYLLP